MKISRRQLITGLGLSGLSALVPAAASLEQSTLSPDELEFFREELEWYRMGKQAMENILAKHKDKIKNIT